MSAGEGVERLARDELLSDLTFEFDAVGAVLGHGLHPLKARRSRSIPNLQAVHRQGRTPLDIGDKAGFAKANVKVAQSGPPDGCSRCVISRTGLYFS
jgi:hypothetical protein